MLHDTSEIDPNRVYTAQEVSEMFGTPVTTIYGWIKRGKLKCLPTIGSSKRFKGLEILAALAVNGFGTTAAPATDADAERDYQEFLNTR